MKDKELNMAYSEEEKLKIINDICERIENGLSLRASTELFKPNFKKTFLEWIKGDKEKSDQYARACKIRPDAIFEEMFDIADNGTNDYESIDIGDGIIVEKVNTDHIQRSKLRIDTRKWALSKMNPKKYGDKVDVTTDGEKINTQMTVKFVDGSKKDKE